MTEDTDLSRSIRQSFAHISLGVPLQEIAAAAKPTRIWTPVRVVSAITVPAAVLLIVAVLVGREAVAPTSVFASWQPTPSIASAALATAARPMCLEPADRDATLVLQDQRGTAAALLFHAGPDLIMCVAVTDASGQVLASSSSSTHIVEGGPQFAIDSVALTGAPGQATLTRMFGRYPIGAAKVELALSDGNVVSATADHGLFLAWWPSGATVSSMKAVASTGEILAALNSPQPAP